MFTGFSFVSRNVDLSYVINAPHSPFHEGAQQSMKYKAAVLSAEDITLALVGLIQRENAPSRNSIDPDNDNEIV
jgi:hypothetical protein